MALWRCFLAVAPTLARSDAGNNIAMSLVYEVGLVARLRKGSSRINSRGFFHQLLMAEAAESRLPICVHLRAFSTLLLAYTLPLFPPADSNLVVAALNAVSRNLVDPLYVVCVVCLDGKKCTR